jgi:hypothetical protein
MRAGTIAQMALELTFYRSLSFLAKVGAEALLKPWLGVGLRIMVRRDLSCGELAQHTQKYIAPALPSVKIGGQELPPTLYRHQGVRDIYYMR